MRLIEAVEEKTEALRVRDIAQILGVSVQQIYKMAAKGEIPRSGSRRQFASTLASLQCG